MALGVANILAASGCGCRLRLIAGGYNDRRKLWLEAASCGYAGANGIAENITGRRGARLAATSPLCRLRAWRHGGGVAVGETGENRHRISS